MIEYIQNNFQTVNMKKLANHFGYNESYLSTLFTKKLNIHFIDLVTNYKMLHAKQLLIQTNQSITEISEALGYNSVDHFSRTFKKNESCSPLYYRKKYKKE